MNLNLLYTICKKIKKFFTAIYGGISNEKLKINKPWYTIDSFWKIYKLIFTCKNYFLDYNLSIRLITQYKKNLNNLENKANFGEAKRMALRERLIHDIEKVREDLEKCLNLSQEDLLCLELEDFYKKISNRKLQSLEKTKAIVLELHESLKFILIKIDRLAKNKSYDIETLLLMSTIFNSKSELIDKYWDYIPPSVKSIFIDIYKLTKDKSSFRENRKSAKKGISLFNTVKLYIQIVFYKLFKSQDPIKELEASLSKYVNSLENAQAEDEEDIADYKYALEAEKKIENEGTIDWNQL